MNRRHASNDKLESLFKKEDCKKACLQSVEHRQSSTLSLAELALISKYPVMKKKQLFNSFERASSIKHKILHMNINFVIQAKVKRNSLWPFINELYSTSTRILTLNCMYVAFVSNHCLSITTNATQ